MTRITTVLILLAAVSSAAVAQPAADSLSLSDALRAALHANPAILRSEAVVSGTEARVKSSRTAQLPAADLDASYTRIGPVPQLGMPGLGTFKLYPENNYDVHLAVREMLFDFGRATAETDVSDADVQSARTAVDLARQRIAFQTVQAFYAMLMLQRSVSVEQQEITTLEEHLAVNRARLATGSATDYDVLTTQVRVAGARNQLVDLENTLRKQEIGLRALMGDDSGLPLRARGEFQADSSDVRTDSLVALALSQRPEYVGAQRAARAAELRSRFASLGSMPSLSAVAEYGFKNGYIPNLDALRGNFVAGVLLRVPLYEGGRTSIKVEEADAAVLAARAKIDETGRDITAEIRQAASDVRAAIDRLRTSALQVEQARDALSIARKRYDTGSISNIDVLDAETALAQADLGRLRALYACVVSRVALNHAAGLPLAD